MANIAAANKEIALNCARKENVRKVTRAASGTTTVEKEREREEIQHDLFPATRICSLKEYGQGVKGKGPKGISPSGTSDQPV